MVVQRLGIGKAIHPGIGVSKADDGSVIFQAVVRCLNADLVKRIVVVNPTDHNTIGADVFNGKLWQGVLTKHQLSQEQGDD